MPGYLKKKKETYSIVNVREACNDRNAFLTSDDQNRFKLWSCQNVRDALLFLLDNILY